MGAKEIDSEHLLLGIIRVDPTTISTVAPALTSEVVRERATSWQPAEARIPNSDDMPLSEDGQRVLEYASSVAKDREDLYVRTEHLLLALAQGPSHAAEILKEAGAESQSVEQFVHERLNSDHQEPEWSRQGDWSIGFQEDLFN